MQDKYINIVVVIRDYVVNMLFKANVLDYAFRSI